MGLRMANRLTRIKCERRSSAGSYYKTETGANRACSLVRVWDGLVSNRGIFEIDKPGRGRRTHAINGFCDHELARCSRARRIG